MTAIINDNIFYFSDTIRDCWLHLISEGITVGENSVRVEWQGTGAGDTTTFTCRLDGAPAVTCKCALIALL